MPRLLSMIVAVVVLVPLTARAQPLADRVPEGSILYVGWRGTNDLGPAYASSHTKALLDASNLPAVFNDVLPKVIAKLGKRDPRALAEFKKLSLIPPAILRHPTAFFLQDIDFTDPQHPIPRGGFICKAGADAPALAKQIADLLAQAGQNELPVRSFQLGDIVALVFGYEDGTMALPGDEGGNRPKPLASSAAFKNAFAKVYADPATAFYLDVEKITTTFEAVLQENGKGEQGVAIALAALDASGLKGVKRIAIASAFDAGDWRTQAFAEIPSPRTGLASLIETKPVSPDILKSIPASSTMLGTAKIDPARFITTLRDIVGQVNPDAQTKFDQGLGAAQLAVGKNLITDILEPLGEDWAVYSSPEVGGTGLLGMVVVNKLDDPAKARQALPMLAIFAGNMLNAYARNEDVAVTGSMVKIDGSSVYYIATPIVTPSWVIKDGYLYLGFYPQTVAAAAKFSGSGAKSIESSEKYIAVQKKLGVDKSTTVSFRDDPTYLTVGGGYQLLLLLSSLPTAADLIGVPTPQPVIPSIDAFNKHISPSGSASWVDDEGWHMKSVASIPFSDLATGQIDAAATAPIMMSILLPSLNRARETANRVKSASNLRQIGQGILLHANDHKGKSPVTLGDVLDQDLTAEVFISPRTSTRIPPNWGSMSVDQRKAWINTSSDYAYVASGKDSSKLRPEDVVAYEKPHGLDDGINILFGDGHVEFLRMSEAQKLAEEQNIDWKLP